MAIEVNPVWRGSPQHRLVTIGDSLTHGFQSGAIFNTDLSYPAIIAHELGWGESFRYPSYNGHGGLPLNIELLLRDLKDRFGPNLDGWEVPLALFHGRQFMDEVEDYWERGPGTVVPQLTSINHNLAVYGWDLRDVLDKTAKTCLQDIGVPRDDWLSQVTQDNGDRAALRVLPSAAADQSLTLLDAAARLGDERDSDPQHGIETLIVFLGANNALQAVTQLKVVWSDTGYDDLHGKRPYTVWTPAHFRAELGAVANRVRQIKARHVIWCTVPHVTIAPVARGVATKTGLGSRYFPYYTRPWISDREFNPRQDPHITGQQAEDVDLAIDLYNAAIVDEVERARRAGADWYLMDTAGLMDRLASRRYIEDPLARPPWWQPYPLPAQLQALLPEPNSRFLASNGNQRTDGGLFSLDGVHPTTIGYGIVAQELITVMRRAGVEFRQADGSVRADPVTVDFSRLIRRDTLINNPPGNLTSGLDILGWADQTLDLLRRTLCFRT
ncbi:hypothetical protein GCM10010274_30280 [Streptomyces lavendofoliae]|uniref:Uncharacterized protein n=1 Tax=Streptomyces lavendofoliae TaxID=67314 RepID=A0A918HZ43_9ACTN|nr:hypothetical protein GCM10010274_30280 [Streptomyces lavendofoliae]